MQEEIMISIEQAKKAIAQLATKEAITFIEAVARRILTCYNQHRKLLIAGNGGSLCDAMHFAEEMTGLFRKQRPPLSALALADPGHLTCVGNDLGFEEVFSRAVEAHGQAGDLLVMLTTSGQSENLIRAAKVAVKKGLGTVAFLGKTGGVLRGMCDLEWIVSGFSFSDRIQEAHMAAIHIIIERVEEALFFDSKSKKIAAEITS
ncbi:MAG: SIS domain-containing protein [Chlamydiota bacterium]